MCWRTQDLGKLSLKSWSTKPVKLVIRHRRSKLKPDTSVYNEWVCVILHEEPVRQRWWRSEEISESGSISWDLISSFIRPIRQWGFSRQDTSLTDLKFNKKKPFWCSEMRLGVVIWAPSEERTTEQQVSSGEEIWFQWKDQQNSQVAVWSKERRGDFGGRRSSSGDGRWDCRWALRKTSFIKELKDSSVFTLLVYK